MKAITKTVWVLSLVSLFTDTASEMLYPIMPIYLQSIGFSVMLIGVLEGIAEATAGLSKGYFGKLSDVTGRRMPFVQWGYALSAVSKPLMVVFALPLWVLMIRTLDRFGKGLRTGARDAALSDEASPETKGRVFGFHRSMDTLGAVAGPLLALLYLHYHPEDYKTLFFIAFIPGVLAVLSTFFLKDKQPAHNTIPVKVKFFSFLQYWKNSPLLYRKLVIGLLVFTLFNSSDVFLLLRLKQTGIDDYHIIMVYIFYNLVYALSAYPLGLIADKFGLKNIFLAGLFIFAGVYFGMAFAESLDIFYLLFFFYGLYAAASESLAKAWISNITNKKDTATAIGTFSGFQSICTMFASSLAGLIWLAFGSWVTFITTGVFTFFVFVYILFAVPLNMTPRNEAQVIL